VGATIATLPRPDLVVSHGQGGEYGHPHHVAVHNAVHRNFDEVWDFADEGGITVPVTADKAALFREVYGGAVLAELRADKPALIDRLFAREHFRPWQRAA
jgi:LmbE family N-acetylglucosaminyl deacetylase